jgi:mevalonate pyrophosphate decarboxylase
MFKKLRRDRLSKAEKKQASEVRRQIIDDAQVVIKLNKNDDFKRFIEMLKEDREGLNKTLLDEKLVIKDRDKRTRLIARINQIDSILDKPRSLIWRMDNLTEVRETLNPREAGSRK